MWIAEQVDPLGAHLNLLHPNAGLRAQYGMRTTPKSMRPPEISRMHGEAANSLPSSAQLPSHLSQAMLISNPSSLPLSLVDAWDASMTHQQGSSQNSSPTALLMGPSPEQPSSTVTSPNKSPVRQNIGHHVDTTHPLSTAASPDRSYPSPGGDQRANSALVADWDEAHDEVVMGEDEPSVVSDSGSRTRFECHHGMCHQRPAGGSAASSPGRQSQTCSSSEGRLAISPPLMLTSSPMRPSPIPQDISAPDSIETTPSKTSGALLSRMPAGHASNNVSPQHADVGCPWEARTDPGSVSTLDRSFVISEGRQQLAGSISIAPRDGASAFPPAQQESYTAGSSGSWDFSKRLSEGCAPSDQQSSSKRLAVVCLPASAPQDDLPQGSPLSRSSSGPLAGRPAIPGSTSTSSPSDLSSPETGIIHTVDSSPSGHPRPSASDAFPQEAADEATSKPQPADESLDQILGGDEEDEFGEFSIGAVHTSPQKPVAAQDDDAVVWRSGISALNSAAQGPSSQPSSPRVSPLAQQASPDTACPATRSNAGSPIKTPMLTGASNPKTPWTVFQTPQLSINDPAMMTLHGSKVSSSGGKGGNSMHAEPESSMYATPGATGMSSVTKTAGSRTPKTHRFDTGLEPQHQDAQWRDLFDGYDSELASPDVGRRDLDSPITPRTRSVLDSPVQQLDLGAANARDGAVTSWAGFNPFFSRS